MKPLLLLSVLVFASFVLARPAFAMSEEANHYTGTDSRANAADSDDADEQFNDAPHTYYSGQSGREEELLQGNTDGRGQTYGFGGYGSGSSYGGNSFGSSSMYYSIH